MGTAITILSTKNIPVDLTSTEYLKFTKGIKIGNEILADAEGNVPYGRISGSEGFQAVLSRITDIEDTIGDEETNGTMLKRIKTLEDTSSSHTSTLTSLDTRITTNAGDISTLNSTVGGHTTAITNIESAIGDATNPTAGTIRARLNAIEDSIGSSGSIGERLTAVEGKASTNETAIGTINSALGDTSNPASGTIRKRIADLESSVDTATTGLKDRMTAVEGQASTNASSISTLTGVIGDDTTAGTVKKRIKDLEDVVPSEATSSNQLADKAFVNSSIQTATAFFDGNWNTYAALPSTLEGFTSLNLPAPGPNNYLVVVADETHSGQTWRYKYTGTVIATASTYDKTLWVAEYKVNDTALTAAQIAALDSGITSALVAKISTNESDIAAINTAIGADDTTGLRKRIADLESTVNAPTTGLSIRMSAVEAQASTNASDISTINTAIGADDTTGLRKRIKDVEDAIGTDTTAGTVKKRIKDIEDVIPYAASSSNELADKAFVNTAVGGVQSNLDGINFLNLPATFKIGNRRYQITINDSDDLVMTRLADVNASE